MAVVEHKLPIVVGEAAYRTRSGIVDTAAVKRGMILILGATGAGYVQPATAAAFPVLGVAESDAAIGERVTYVIAPCDVRVMLTESMTITPGDSIIAATITIAGVVTPGHVGELAALGAPSNPPTQAEVTAITSYITQRFAYALESVSTDADVAKLLKVRLL